MPARYRDPPQYARVRFRAGADEQAALERWWAQVERVFSRDVPPAGERRAAGGDAGDTRTEPRDAR